MDEKAFIICTIISTYSKIHSKLAQKYEVASEGANFWRWEGYAPLAPRRITAPEILRGIKVSK